MWVMATTETSGKAWGNLASIQGPAQCLALPVTFVIGFSDWSQTVCSTTFLL